MKRRIMDLAFYSEARKVWSRITKNAVPTETVFDFDFQKKILDIFQIGNYYYYIFDIKNLRFEFMSPEIVNVLGYKPAELNVEFFMSKIHPDDQVVFLNHENTVIDFFSKLPHEKFKKYKVSYDYRVRNASGQYLRILQQVVVLQCDEHRNLQQTLGVHTDISNLKTNNQSVLSFIGLDGEPSFYDVDVRQVYKPSRDIFTKREKQIVQLLLNGKQTADIARTLSISKFTVDTHRKNILIKTKTKNALELAIKVITENLV
ncbi:MAG TPA: LuxR C-terminal-related transcriptional regulator [Flavobacterium sp.]|nr:LuxR C-terminal-related transcriptional regulator [Flavobacterium sp.]